MRRCQRPEAPALLLRHGPTIAGEFVARREADPGCAFSWPHRERQHLLAIVRDALRPMTDAHCAYCDGRPLDELGEEVDHFQPASRFPQLACDWANLFLVCTRCNRRKRDQWEPALLRPDAEDYAFERYFEYRFDTGELQPSGAAHPDDQERARRIIVLLALNRPGLCELRRRTVRDLRRKDEEHERELLSYRYLAPLVSPDARYDWR